VAVPKVYPAVTFPFSDTVAIVLLEDDHVTFLFSAFSGSIEGN